MRSLATMGEIIAKAKNAPKTRAEVYARFKRMSDEELQEVYGDLQDLGDSAWFLVGLHYASKIDDIFANRATHTPDSKEATDA